MLFTNPLEKSTIITARTNCKTNLIVLISFETIKPSLNGINPSINSKVVLENKMDSIRCHSTSLSHQNSLTILMKTDV
jgi:hypothetical protein